MEKDSKEYQQLSEELKKLGYVLESFPNKMQDSLLKIKIFSDERIRQEKELHVQFSKQYVSKKSISDATGVSRTTMMHNNVIGEYVASKIKEFELIDDSKKYADALEEIDVLKKRVQEGAKRDIEVVELRKQNKRLKEILKNYGINYECELSKI